MADQQEPAATDAADAAAATQSALGQYLGFELVEADASHAVARLSVDPERHTTPLGAVHTGTIVALADNTATQLANRAQQGGPNEGRFMLAIDLHCTLLANQQGGTIVAEARPVRVGRRVTVVRTAVTGEGGRLLAEVTTTHIPA
jgi:1,4-dihydroxy-2-naphthoyl-CoA hydrolase